MSRIGKRPVVLPKGVTAKFEGDVLHVKGPKGDLHFNIDKQRYNTTESKIADGTITVTRKDESGKARAEQGLIRALIQNMAVGVSEGYSCTLDVVGVGYKAELKGKVLNLALGFSHPVDYPIPDGITVTVDKQTRIVIKGADKKLVGEMGASIRSIRPPEPYKGKGVRYADEIIKKKVGKAAAGSTAGG